MEWMILPLKRYAEFSGRSRRMEYWMYTLGVFLVYLVLMVVVMAVGFGAMGMASQSSNPGAGVVGMMASMGLIGIVFVIILLGLLIPSIAVAVRRLHDTDRSGWWLLMPIAPYILVLFVTIAGAAAQSQALMGLGLVLSLLQWVASIVLLVFYCLPGTVGPNRYGPDPINPGANLSQTFQ